MFVFADGRHCGGLGDGDAGGPAAVDDPGDAGGEGAEFVGVDPEGLLEAEGAGAGGAGAVELVGPFGPTNFPQVLRTTEQFTSPLRDEKSDVWAAGLRLESVEWRTQECPFARSYAEHRDPERLAREYVPTLRSWSEPPFANGLSPDRSPHERLAVLDEFYSRYGQLVAKDPEGHRMDLVEILMTCVRA